MARTGLAETRPDSSLARLLTDATIRALIAAVCRGDAPADVAKP